MVMLALCFLHLLILLLLCVDSVCLYVVECLCDDVTDVVRGLCVFGT